MRSELRAILALSGTALVIGCGRDTTMLAPTTGGGAEGAPATLQRYQNPDTTIEPAGTIIGHPPRFAVAADLSVQGSLEPGSPIIAVGRASMTVPARDLELSIWSPELEFAKSSSFDQGYHIKGKGVIPSLAEDAVAGSLESPEYVTTASFSIPAAGIYRVIFSARVTPIVTDFATNGSVHKTAWLLIDEKGGRIIEDFTLDSIPAEFTRETGPFRSAMSAATPGPHRVAGDAPLKAYPEDGTTAIHVYYVDEDAQQTVDVAGATVLIQQYDAYLNPMYPQPAGVTDANGIATIACDVTSYTAYVQDVWPVLYGDEVTVEGYPLSSQAPTAIACGSPATSYNWDVGSGGEVFRNYEDDIVPTAESLFSGSRSRIAVKVYSDTTHTSNYSSGPDDIEIYGNAIWAGYGDFTQAHEYGHAFHEKALGGNAASGPCNGEHTFIAKNTYGCAFSEGFADFFAMAVGHPYFLTDATLYERSCTYYRFDQTPNYCQTWGSDGLYLMETEGAVAAFLYDVIDSSNSDSLDGVSFDHVTISAADLADIYETCLVDSARPGVIYRLVHCIQREIDGYDTDFPGTAPYSYSVTAGHNPDPDDVRLLWRTHLRNKTTLLDPLSAGIYGPSSVKSNDPGCAWDAVVTGGVAPYSYSWSGILSGSSDQVTGGTSSSGTLYLTVTDAASTVRSTSMYVTVNPGAVTCDQ